MIEAAVRAGLLDDARALLEDRLSSRCGSDGFASRRLAMLSRILPSAATAIEPSAQYRG